MTTMSSKQWNKLREKLYRQHFVEAQVKRGVPFQMKALLKKQKLSQAELADRAGLTQGAVSRALNPNYGNLTLNTIIRIAAGFDVAFVGLFVPFSKLLDYSDSLSEEGAADVPSFVEEDQQSSRQAERTAKLSPFLTRTAAPEAQMRFRFTPPAEVTAVASERPVPSNDAKHPEPPMELYGRTDSPAA